MLEAAPDILGRLDEDVAGAMLDVLRGEVVEFVTRAEVTEVRDGLSQTACINSMATPAMVSGHCPSSIRVGGPMSAVSRQY
ncbi:hypothetical protein SAMN05421874_12346 [Nonomuraea maritima]|uniref:Uncharacterized protein n=1 Tax=Nonomuraea maritima TaxID=683260 RepID=A0A1G9KSM5_9ACTN|nr:hypothetical protein SAMN05421874_12346 [Nonomuraea maritima]